MNYQNYCEKVAPNCQIICVNDTEKILLDSHINLLKSYSDMFANMCSDVDTDCYSPITILYPNVQTLFDTIMCFYSIETTGTFE